jgi:hypothetical protein
MVRQKPSPPTQWDLLSLTSADGVSMVVRGHLILEALLNALLELTVPNQCKELLRLNFAQKLDLAIALGCLPSDYRGSWRMANDLRNKFAHDLHAELTGSDAENLLNAMPSSMREQIRAQRRALNGLGKSTHRTPDAVVTNCLSWLATFASRAVVERGGQPLEPVFPFDEDSG